MRRLRIGGWAVLLLGVLLWGWPAELRAQSPDTSVALTELKFYVVGMQIKPTPDKQAVPKELSTTVNTEVVLPTAEVSFADLKPLLPKDLVIKAQLRGPAFSQPLTLTTLPNVPFTIPTLPIVGIYTLENIRMESGGELIAASPNVVTIESFEKVLVTQVTTRPLTLQEIQDRGVLIDTSNFNVISFNTAIAVQSDQVKIEFPVLIPKTPVAVPAEQGGGMAMDNTPQIPTLQVDIPNLQVSGFVMKEVEISEEQEIKFPPISGIIVIPGNIGYLHQFFDVTLLVTNGAPAGSGLYVKDLAAEIVLPIGEDKTGGTDAVPGDDPLRVAKTSSGNTTRTLPVVGPGVDGRFGTADDTLSFNPGESGQASFTVEGLKEGAFPVDFNITATLVGLPKGPVKITGKASGSVLVRNPNFSIALSHPKTIRAGERYTLFATVTNTSDALANLVSISLDPRGVSGAELIGDSTVQIETLLPHASATVSFKLKSKVTGKVTATVFQSDDAIKGKFILRAGVGDNGIPLSPDTLVLPAFTDNLPADLVAAGVGLLGEAYSIATAPAGALPPNISRISRATVDARAIDLAEAGLRLSLGEPLVASVEDLLFDFIRSDVANAPFDQLRRFSDLAKDFHASAGGLLWDEFAQLGTIDFQKKLAERTLPRGPQISVIAGSGVNGAPVKMEIVDAQGGKVSAAESGIPYAEMLAMADPEGLGLPAALGLITIPSSDHYTVTVTATGGGMLDLGVVLPNGTQSPLRQIVYPSLLLAAGDRLTVTLSPNGANDFLLKIDRGGDGSIDETVGPAGQIAIADIGPTIEGATQVFQIEDADRYGRLLAVLFSEKVTAESAKTLANYLVEANQVMISQLQPSGRFVFLLLRDPVGPYIPRTITVSNIRDLKGNSLAPNPTVLPIQTTAATPGAVVSGRIAKVDGSPVAGAVVRLIAFEESRLFASDIEVTVSEKTVDSEGRYQFDYVINSANKAARGFKIEAQNPATGDKAALATEVAFGGQQINLDLTMPGRGTVIGTIKDKDNLPLPGAVVQVRTFSPPTQTVVAANGQGQYIAANIPVGNFRIEGAAGNARGQANGFLPAAGETITQDLNLFVAPATLTGTITGKVFGADGLTPQVKVPVVLSYGGSQVTYTSTDQNGSYSFFQVPIGPVNLHSFNQGTKQQGDAASRVEADQTAVINIFYKGLGGVTGTVFDASGAAVAGALVIASSGFAYSDAQGHFTITGIPVGSVSVTAQDPVRRRSGATTVTISETGQTVTANIFLNPLASIAGTVYARDGVTPVAGAEVRIVIADGAGECLCKALYIFTITDAQGHYRFDDLPLNSRTPLIAVKGTEVGNTDYRLSFDNQVLLADITFIGTGEVTGTVLDAGSGNTPAGANVALRGIQKDEVGRFRYIVVGTTQSDPSTGRFRFTGLYPGNFNVTAFNVFRPVPVSVNGTIRAAGDVQDVTLTLKPNQGSVSGKVFLPNGAASAGAGIRVTLQLGGQPITVTTDETGHYRFSPILPEGGYPLIGEDPISGLKATTSVSVRAGQEVSADLRLLGRGTVVVKVNDAAGAPVPTATVKLTGNGFPYDKATLPLALSDHGQVTFTNVTEGNLSVEATDPNNFGGRVNGVLPADGQTITIEVRLAPSGRVIGRFLSPDGINPIGNAQMTLSVSGRTVGFVTTSTDPLHLGEYGFDHVPLGSITVEGFDPVTVRKGRNSGSLAQNDQTLTLDVLQVSRGTVKGTVLTGDGLGPVPAAAVSLFTSGLFPQSFSATSSVDGSFSFPGISAGSFTIQVSDSATGLSGNGKGTLIREGEVVDVPILLQPSGNVTGTVYQPDGTTPAAFAQVALTAPISRTVQSDESGRYSFKFIPVGNISVKATELNGPDGGLGQGKLSAQGETATVNITFNGAGRIEGTIFGSNGTTPAPGILVRLNVAGPFGTALAATSDANGHYLFPRVPSGSFSLTAADPGGLLGGSAGGAITTNGQALTVNITLQGSGSVAGTVRKPDGLTVAAGAIVTLKGTNFTLAQETDAQGAFRFDGIPLGALTVDLQDPFGKGFYHLTGSLTQNGQTLDFGTIVLDDQAISVAAVDPVDGSVNIPLTPSIQISFSEKADLSTLTASNIGLFEGATRITTSQTITPDGTAVLLQPSSPLKGFTRYTVKVAAGIKDPSGRTMLAAFQSSFMTIDTFPPTVVSVSPVGLATQVATDSVVRIVLSEAIDPASVSSTYFKLIRNGTPVDGRIDLINNQSVLVFTPLAPLSANASYTVSLSGIKDLVGNVLAAPLSVSFATIDTIPPTVTGLALAGNPSRILGTTVTVAATVTDTDIAFVDFLADEKLIGTDALPPYSASALLSPVQGSGVTFKAIAVDRAGNSGPAALLVVDVLPNVPPTIQVGSVPPTINLGEQLALSVTGSDDVAVKEITLALSGAIQSTETRTNPFASASFTATFSIPIAANLPVGGTVNATMTVRDSVGNAVSESRSFTIVDTLAPQIRFVQPASGIIITGQAVDLTLEVNDAGRIASVALFASNGEIVGTTPVAVSPAAERVTLQWRWVASATIPIGEVVSLTAQADDLTGNRGTTASALTLRVVPVPPSLTSITAVAQTGSAADPAKPSANIGQTLSLAGDHLRSDLLVRMTTRLANGILSTVDLPLVPGSLSGDGTTASVRLDPTKPIATGPVQWVDPTSGLTSTPITVQVVPTIDRFDAPIFSSLQPMTVLGSGLVDGVGRIEFTGASGTIVLNDNGSSLVSTDANRKLSLLIPIGVVEGPVTVVTDGGRSAPLNLRLPQITGVAGVAAEGSPADPAKASANVGQTITIQGSGIRSELQLRVTTVNDDGVKSTADLPLTSVASDGGTAGALLTGPVTTGTVRLFDPAQGTGSGSSTTLQIVPTVTSLVPADFTTGTRVQLSGSGFVENGITVKLPTGGTGTTSLIDNGAIIDVADGNRSAFFLMPAGVVAGPLTVVTSGGTSNLIAIGQNQPIEISVAPDPINLTIGEHRTILIALSRADFVNTTLSLSVSDAAVASLSSSSIVIPSGATQGAVVLTALANGTTSLNIQAGSITKKVPLFVTSPFGDPVFSIAPSVGVILASPTAPASATIDPVVSPPLGVIVQTPASSTTLTLSPVLSSAVGVAMGPAVTGLLPASGVVGTSRLDLRIIGTNLAGVTSIQFIPNTGLTLLDAPFVSADGGSVTVGVAIASNAPTGVRKVLVQTALGIVRPTIAGADLFLVTLPQPEILSITPITKPVGSTFTLTVNGKNLSGATAVTFNPPDGIAVGNPPTVDGSGTTATVNVTIGATAAVGARVVTVTTPAGTTSAVSSPANTFTITATSGTDFSAFVAPSVGVMLTPPATITTIPFEPIVSAPVGIAKGAVVTGMTPTSGVIGTSLTLHLLGTALEGVTSVTFVPNTGLTVGVFTVSADGRDVAVPVTIASDAPTTVRTVVVKTGTATLPVAAAGANLFLVTLPQPEIFSITPITKSVGSTFTLTVGGKNLNGATAVSFNPPEGIAVGNPPTVSIDGTTATVNVTLGTGAAVGARIVTVTTPAGTTSAVASPANTFTITATSGTDFSALVAPSVGVVLTPPASGPTMTAFDSVVAPQLGVQFGAAGGGSVTATFSPIVSPTVGVSLGESMSGVTPSVASPGASNLAVVVSGSDLSRVISVSFVPATGLSVVNPPTIAADGKSLTVLITVASDAPLGVRQIKINTANGAIQPTAAGVNRFTIAPPTPDILSITPNTATIGSTFTLTVRGRNFSGATTVALAPADGISVGNPPLVNLDGTEATVQVSLSFLASAGPRLVTITTPSGTSSDVASPANTFTVVGSGSGRFYWWNQRQDFNVGVGLLWAGLASAEGGIESRGRLLPMGTLEVEKKIKRVRESRDVWADWIWSLKLVNRQGIRGRPPTGWGSGPV